MMKKRILMVMSAVLMMAVGVCGCSQAGWCVYS